MSENQTTYPNAGSEVAVLSLKVTDSTGRVHELEIKKIEGVGVPEIYTFGDNLKLQRRMKMLLDYLDRQGQTLI